MINLFILKKATEMFDSHLPLQLMPISVAIKKYILHGELYILICSSFLQQIEFSIHFCSSHTHLDKFELFWFDLIWNL